MGAFLNHSKRQFEQFISNRLGAHFEVSATDITEYRDRSNRFPEKNTYLKIVLKFSSKDIVLIDICKCQ